jgi:hypothetical protein
VEKNANYLCVVLFDFPTDLTVKKKLVSLSLEVKPEIVRKGEQYFYLTKKNHIGS